MPNSGAAQTGLPIMSPATVSPVGEVDEPVRIVSITVKPSRLVVDVSILDELNRRTTPERAAHVLERFPTLREHACVNGRGRTFGSVIESTSIAHLLEHLAIELQTRASAHEAATFVGTTEWLDERVGLARIQLSFKDDLEALRALRDAVRFLNDMLSM